ncbi:MAG: hydroxyphenylacetyl-CoA thioesterase PaaI [Stappiaceae bacterium]
MSITDPQALAEAASDAMWAGDKASKGMGMQREHVGPGEARLSMIVTEAMANGHGMCHGGYIFSLADSAFAFACNSYNQNTLAQHCAISFLVPAAIGDRLTATASERHREERSGIYDVAVSRADGTLIAEFRGHSRTIKGTHIG